MRLPRSIIPVVATLAGGACTWDWDRHDLSPRGPGGRWLVTFRDECDGATVDRTRWNTTFVHKATTFRRYSWANSYVDDANVTVADGTCRITVERRAQGGATFTSGVMDSSNHFEQQYGFFEIRLQVLRGPGVQTVAALSAKDAWPPAINIVDVGKDAGRATHLVWYDDGGEDARSEILAAMRPGLAEGMHTFGLDWTPTELVFYIDGVETGRGTRSAPFLTRPMRWEITAHVGGEHQPEPDATTPLPSQVLIDWIRAYQRAP